ncbi:MAG: xylulokinase [Ascidiaceihabitans sp.]|nr:xylulokinase [Ascidiaceihabitans sp.]
MFIGLDLGTSGLRALLVDAQGTAVASADAGYGVAHLHQGWSEQDPADWVHACQKVIATLVETHPKEMQNLAGIGLSGHMHGATLLDKTGAVLRPCILWNDTRSHVQAAELDSDPQFRALTGNIVFPGFTAPKLAWVAQHEPDVFAQVAKVLLPKDYMTFWLTGSYSGDMSDCAGTAWFDVGARDWSDDLLAATNLTRDHMPTLFEGSQVVGKIRPDLATALGLPNDVQIVAGGGDNAVAACGVGGMKEGDGFVSLGTSGVLLAARDGFAPMADSAVHTFCHAVPQKWYQMGVVLAATDSLNWLAGITGATPAELTAELGETLGPPTALRFYPYLSGERTPHNDSAVRGGFINIDIATTRADMTHAVMTGVSFALRDSLEALRKTGANLQSVLAIGGGAASPLWVEMLATVLNLPLDLPEQGEFGAALGAARLAICGVTGQPVAQVMTKPKVSKTIHPRADLVAAYDASYAQFAASFPTLKALQ